MELHAALHRKHREGGVSQTQLETIFRQYDLDESMELWNWLPLTETIINTATQALRALPASVYLRTADALHLATASISHFREIYSNDTHLLAAAACFEIAGKNILDPV
jgi:predicted nucleic acid-binding protein